jgi:hypothetical protein
LQSLENGDHGYGSTQGLASDLESTRFVEIDEFIANRSLDTLSLLIKI